MAASDQNQQIWYTLLHDGYPPMLQRRRVYQWLPSNPRCVMCLSPFAGLGGAMLRLLLRVNRSNYNPQLCNTCENMVRNYPGGTEVELTMLFADVRGSTTLAEGMSPSAFSQLIGHYYTVATSAVTHHGGLIEKFVGDNATVLFPPGIAGAEHARHAIETARYILRNTGHDQPGHEWITVGAGVHTGNAFVGSLGTGGVSQLTALGDAANTAARLSSSAAAGEILVSEQTMKAARWPMDGLEQRELMLKGKTVPIRVYVLRVDN